MLDTTSEIFCVSVYIIKYLFREHIEESFELKEQSIGSPEKYLGKRLRKADLEKLLRHGRLVLTNIAGPSLRIWKGIGKIEHQVICEG